MKFETLPKKNLIGSTRHLLEQLVLVGCGFLLHRMTCAKIHYGVRFHILFGPCNFYQECTHFNTSNLLNSLFGRTIIERAAVFSSIFYYVEVESINANAIILRFGYNSFQNDRRQLNEFIELCVAANF